MTESLDAQPYTSATVYSAIPMPMKLKILLMKLLKGERAIVSPVRCGYLRRTLLPFGNCEHGSSKEEIGKERTPKT